MTIEERFERIEHVTAGLAEERRKDREESRELWRSTQQHLDQLAARVDQIAVNMDRFVAEAAERDKHFASEMAALDHRIDALVSAIGEFIRRKDAT